MDGTEQRIPAVVRTYEGERRAVLLQLAPASSDHAVDARAGIVAVFEDVTDEFRARQAIAKSEARYRSIFEGASDAIYTLDANGAFTSVNSATCRITGCSADEMIGRSMVPFLDETELPIVIEHFRAACTGDSRHHECHLTRKTGERVLCSVTYTPVRSEDEIIGVLGIARDVSSLHQATIEREELRRQLGQSQKLEAIGQLVSGVAHELNNPLAAVMAYAQLLLSNDELLSDDRSAVETMLHESKRAARIVANLLTFARQHQPERSVTDINQVVKDTMSLRRYSLNERNIALVIDLDDRLPLTWADSFQVQQVLLNLMTNAEQALRDWNGTRSIRVSTRYEAETIRLSVADTGPGITAPVLEQIFNPFFTTKGVGEGTGLGLAIADGIVREHGGHIRAESISGHGATFSVELPFIDPAFALLGAPPAASTPSATISTSTMPDDDVSPHFLKIRGTPLSY
jgi:two-component system NtrC family sensor kinase